MKPAMLSKWKHRVTGRECTVVHVAYFHPPTLAWEYADGTRTSGPLEEFERDFEPAGSE